MTDGGEELGGVFDVTKARAEKAEAKLASIGELVAGWTCTCCDCDEGCKPCLRCHIEELVKL